MPSLRDQRAQVVEPDGPQDVANRLRGRIIIPITDGLGPVDGMDPFVRDFGYQGDLPHRAADTIESLVAGEEIDPEVLENLILELMIPADPLDTGSTYVVPIRRLAAQTIQTFIQNTDT